MIKIPERAMQRIVAAIEAEKAAQNRTATIIQQTGDTLEVPEGWALDLKHGAFIEPVKPEEKS